MGRLDTGLKQTGLCLVALANVLALCADVAAEPTPSAVPALSLELPPGPPSTAESEPSQEQAPAPGAAPQSEAGWQLPPLVPRPDFISRRPFIPDFLLKDKREGRFITAVPAIGWDQQAGLNLGVVGFLFDNGTKDDPFFRTTPYRRQISVTALGSLSGLQRYGATLDQPNILDSPYRLRADVQYAIDALNNYFGIGRTSMQDFNFPGAPGQFFKTYNGYQNALQQEVNGFAYTKYDLYESRETSFGVAVERDVFGGIVRPLIGVAVRCTDLRDVTGSRVDAENSSGDDVRAIEQTTRMHTDCQKELITGCSGGFDNILKLGVSAGRGRCLPRSWTPAASSTVRSCGWTAGAPTTVSASVGSGTSSPPSASTTASARRAALHHGSRIRILIEPDLTTTRWRR